MSPGPDFEGQGGITAVLGPTNTGKTHRAVERMLRFRTGMIGLPLRLLAREIYDRVALRVGSEQVALVTGEEKIVPPQARYWVCTVEAMPLDRPVAFLAVDEVQLAAHRERGHVFTDRLLNARGLRETWFLGAETIGPLLEDLVPTARFETHPRFSRLSHAGFRKLDALPPRSAVVAFALDEVYALAERLKARHGGTAVVLGALAPRTRNAQVELFQQGEVQYMVATDAIGMGLNLDLDHVALASVAKFDGQETRPLEAAELAQVAGRAGRYRRDGTFGTTGDLGALPEELSLAVEEHRFPALRHLWYRNSELDFRSPAALRDSLRAEPRRGGLRRVRDAEDERSLEALLRREDVLARARGAARVALLWDVCRIPDYRKQLFQDHYALLADLYLQLSGPSGLLDEAWVDARLRRLDRITGEIDALMTRIAFVRTWTYVAFQGSWLADPRPWQERTRAIEDRLSDALHQRLARRFVDRRALWLLRPSAPGDLPPVSLDADGGLSAGEHPLGRLEGLRFIPEGGLAGFRGQAAWRAVRRAVQDLLERRVRDLETAEDEALEVDRHGFLTWEGARLGCLEAGEELLAPKVQVLQQELGTAEQRERVRRRLEGWVRGQRDGLLEPLRRPFAADLGPAGRALVYRLEQALGLVSVEVLRGLPGQLSDRERRLLARLDVRLGTRNVYVAGMLAPRWLRWRAVLACVAARHLPLPPLDWLGEPSVPRPAGLPEALAAACGYTPLGERLVRVDTLEDFAFRLRRAARSGPFAVPDEVAATLGCAPAEADRLALALGFEGEEGEDGRIALRAPAREGWGSGTRHRFGGGRCGPATGRTASRRS